MIPCSMRAEIVIGLCKRSKPGGWGAATTTLTIQRRIRWVPDESDETARLCSRPDWDGG